MEKWDGVVLDDNVTCAMSRLGGTVCSHRIEATAITGCDTVSYPVGNGNTSGLCVSGQPHGSRGTVHRSTAWATFKLLHDSIPLHYFVYILVRRGIRCGDVCRNSFTKKEDETEDEEHHNYDHCHDNDHGEQDKEEYDQLDDRYLMREPGRIDSEIHVVEIARCALMYAYAYNACSMNMRPTPLYILQKYDLFTTAECSFLFCLL